MFAYNVHDLLLCEAVFAELSQEQTHLLHITAEEVRPIPKNMNHLVFINLVVELEQEETFFHLCF